MSETEVVELRCPIGPQQLLGKVLRSGVLPVSNDNLMEVACRDCARSLRTTETNILRVVHRFNLAGELVESLAVKRD